MIEEITEALSRGLDISHLISNYGVTQFSGNSSADGAILFFIENEIGCKCVVKSQRYHSLSYAENRRKVFADRYVGSAKELVVPELVVSDRRVYEIQRYVPGLSLKAKIRIPLAVTELDGFNIGMNLCSILSGVRSDGPASRNHASVSRPNRGCILHNDLAPTNIILSKDVAYLIDWDGVDLGPSVFNFYDFTFHYMSLLVSGRHRRRSIRSYTSVFNYFTFKASAELRKSFCTNLLQHLGTLDASDVKNSLSEFLAYRAAVTGGHLDLIWRELGEYESELKEGIVSILRKDCDG